MASVIDLSVVVPVFNEAGVIGELVEDLERELVPLVDVLEVIVVDDASTDATPAILARLAADRAWLSVVRAEENAGHGPSVSRGMALAQADWVFQIDSDGQFLVSEFERLWARRDECDLALGVRTERNDPPHRLLLSRIVRAATSLLAGARIRDANTPFRLVRRDLWVDATQFMSPGTLAPNILVTLAAAVRGRRVIDVPVTHLARERGVSTLRKVRLVRFSLRGLGQLVVFRYRLARAPRTTPAHEPAV